MPSPSSNASKRSYSILADQVKHISIAIERLQKQLEEFDDPADSPYVQSLMDSSYDMGYEQGYQNGLEEGYNDGSEDIYKDRAEITE